MVKFGYFSALTNVVTKRGELNRKACLAKIKQARILVHTSEYESQGYALCEGLALGCHVVTLSKGLEVSSEHFTIVNDTDELYEKTDALLRQTKRDHVSFIPISMADTVFNYEELFQNKEVTFE